MEPLVRYISSRNGALFILSPSLVPIPSFPALFHGLVCYLEAVRSR